MEVKIDNLALISYDSYDRIITIRFTGERDLHEDDAEKMSNEIRKICGNESHGNLIITKDLLYISRSVRKKFAELGKDTVLAIALVINSSLQKGIANLFMKFDRPDTETKTFIHEENAYEWLQDKIRSKLKQNQ